MDPKKTPDTQTHTGKGGGGETGDGTEKNNTKLVESELK